MIAASFASWWVTGEDQPFGVLSAAIVTGPIAVYGAVVARAWVLLMPLMWLVLFLGVFRLVDLMTGRCTPCTPEGDWASFPVFYFFFVVVPLTGASLAGVVVGVALRHTRRLVT